MVLESFLLSAKITTGINNNGVPFVVPQQVCILLEWVKSKKINM
jgi:hypothetical protein